MGGFKLISSARWIVQVISHQWCLSSYLPGNRETKCFFMSSPCG